MPEGKKQKHGKNIANNSANKKCENRKNPLYERVLVVGVTGFEPATF
jgi:hypothetical protein